MILIKEGRGEDIIEQVNPRSHTSPVCPPPALCACSNSWLCPPTGLLFSPTCSSAGDTRLQMKRQSAAESDKCVISHAGSSHWQEVHSVCLKHHGNCPLQNHGFPVSGKGQSAVIFLYLCLRNWTDTVHYNHLIRVLMRLSAQLKCKWLL